VHRVVDDFLRQVVGPRGVRIHARAALDRIQAGEDFDVGGVVAGIHRLRRSGGGSCEARRMRAGGRVVKAGPEPSRIPRRVVSDTGPEATPALLTRWREAMGVVGDTFTRRYRTG